MAQADAAYRLRARRQLSAQAVRQMAVAVEESRERESQKAVKAVDFIEARQSERDSQRQTEEASQPQSNPSYEAIVDSCIQAVIDTDDEFTAHPYKEVQPTSLQTLCHALDRGGAVITTFSIHSFPFISSISHHKYSTCFLR